MISRIIPLLLALAGIGIFLGYVHPTYTGEVALLRSEIEGFDAALDAAKEFNKQTEQVNKAREAIPAEGRQRIEAFLPDGVDNVQLILDLNALADRSGIRLSDFDIRASEQEERAGRGIPEAEGGVESLDIAVSGLGTYSAFRTFLEGVEWSLRPLDLINVSVSDSDTGVYSYAMTFRIYWLR
jgi:hypothetical protein